MEELSDEQLIAIHSDIHATATKRNEAINDLFHRYQSRVALWCYRIVGDRDCARDLSQEVFLRALRGLSTFRGDSKFSTWLYTIARNHSKLALGKVRSMPMLESVRLGKRVLIRTSTLERYIAAMETTATVKQ